MNINLKNGYKKWYKFGFHWFSLEVLWKRNWIARLNLFRSVRMFWQRGRRGWSDEDVWGFSSYLARIIREGVKQLAHESHGHPMELTWGEWAKILAEIQEGMWASKHMDEATYEPNSPEAIRDQQQFDLAMEHLHKWWFGLWD